MALVFEDPLRRDVKPGLRGVLAQRRGLRPDRLVFLQPGAGDPGVDRRAGHGAAVPPRQAARCGPPSVAPIWRRPLTTPWPRDGRRRTPPRPPGRSPAGTVSAAARQPFQPPVAQRDIEAEVIYCVGGVTTPLWGVPSSVGANPFPGSNTPAFSQSAIIPLAGKPPIAWSR